MRCQRPSAPFVYCVRALTQPPLAKSTGTSLVDETVIRLRSGSIVQRKLAPANVDAFPAAGTASSPRSEEHTSELQSLMRISYAVFCLKKKTMKTIKSYQTTDNTQTTITN